MGHVPLIIIHTSGIVSIGPSKRYIMLIIIYSVTRWLMAKNWLVHRKRSIELAAKRTWNKYWVCLKGNVLLFHVCDDGKEVTDDRTPKYRLGDRLQCVIYICSIAVETFENLIDTFG